MTTNARGQVCAPRWRRTSVGAALTVAIALVGAASVQAGPTTASRPGCTITVNAAHWKIRGAGSGSTYRVVATGMSCSVAGTWVRKLSALKGNPGGGGTFRGGPAGFTCRSLSIPVSGDKLIYAGACVHSPGKPFFGWAPKP
jgi:hypothetical protein